MTSEMTDHVPGLDDARVSALVDEAEVGYDLGSLRSETNPHAGSRPVVPEDLLAEVQARAERDGLSPDEVVREALEAHLRTA